MPKFETFTKTHVAATKSPALTIQRSGQIAVNVAAYVALGRPKAVHLLFAPEEQIVGLQPCGEDERDAYFFRSQGRGTGDDGPFNLGAQAFCKHYGIDTSAGRRYPATMDDGVLCIDLKTDPLAGPRRRGREASDDAEEVRVLRLAE